MSVGVARVVTYAWRYLRISHSNKTILKQRSIIYCPDKVHVSGIFTTKDSSCMKSQIWSSNCQFSRTIEHLIWWHHGCLQKREEEINTSGRGNFCHVTCRFSEALLPWKPQPHISPLSPLNYTSVLLNLDRYAICFVRNVVSVDHCGDICFANIMIHCCKHLIRLISSDWEESYVLVFCTLSGLNNLKLLLVKAVVAVSLRWTVLIIVK